MMMTSWSDRLKERWLLLVAVLIFLCMIYMTVDVVKTASYSQGYFDGLTEGIPDLYVKACSYNAYKGYDTRVLGNLSLNITNSGEGLV